MATAPRWARTFAALRSRLQRTAASRLRCRLAIPFRAPFLHRAPSSAALCGRKAAPSFLTGCVAGTDLTGKSESREPLVGPTAPTGTAVRSAFLTLEDIDGC